MTDTFTKSSANNRGEAAGLTWLGQVTGGGGARVARVIHVDDSVLEIERIKQTAPSPENARAFGRALAHTHAAGAPWWGCTPEGWIGPDHIGRSRTKLFPEKETAPTSFGQLYGEHRIADFAKRIVDRGVITAKEARIFDDLAERLIAGDFDSEQPKFVQDAGFDVARLHGDMWAGNVLYCGGPTGAALIDPMAHGGHAETDLAALAVFGFPYLEEVYAGYDEASPLADGWRERSELHQLGMIIMHAHLFEGHYVGWAEEVAGRYV